MTTESAAKGTTERAIQASTQVLQDLLAELIDLSLLAQHTHWNVVGTKSDMLRRLVEDARITAVCHARAVAQRISALGAYPDGRVHVVAGLSHLPQPKVGRLPDTYALGQLATTYRGIIHRVRNRAHLIGGTDQETQMLLVQVATELEAQHETFQSSTKRIF